MKVVAVLATLERITTPSNTWMCSLSPFDDLHVTFTLSPARKSASRRKVRLLDLVSDAGGLTMAGLTSSLGYLAAAINMAESGGRKGVSPAPSSAVVPSPVLALVPASPVLALVPSPPFLCTYVGSPDSSRTQHPIRQVPRLGAAGGVGIIELPCRRARRQTTQTPRSDGSGDHQLAGPGPAARHRVQRPRHRGLVYTSRSEPLRDSRSPIPAKQTSATRGSSPETPPPQKQKTASSGGAPSAAAAMLCPVGFNHQRRGGPTASSYRPQSVAIQQAS